LSQRFPPGGVFRCARGKQGEPEAGVMDEPNAGRLLARAADVRGEGKLLIDPLLLLLSVIFAPLFFQPRSRLRQQF